MLFLKKSDGLGIVSFSQERWNSVWRSRHQIMSILAHKNKVLFISTPFTIRDAIKIFISRNENNEGCGLKKINKDLFSYQPPLWLPTLYRYQIIESVIARIRRMHLKFSIKKIELQPDIIYIWHPSFANRIDDFDDALIVYHCYDEYSTFDDINLQNTQLSHEEIALLKRADIVFTVSEKTKQRRLPFNSNIHVVTNGVNFQLFSRAQDAKTCIPEDLKVIRGPIIGLVTTLTTILDVDLLISIFELRPKWSFVFIGLMEEDPNKMNNSLRYFLKLPNVHVIGTRKQEEIPGYLKGCDVCTIPWILNELSMSGSPLKLYEYLAAGKPVVSTPLSHLLFLRDVICFAKNTKEWIDAIEAALNDDARVLERQCVAREHTWDKKVEFITHQLVITKKKTRLK